MIPQTFFFFWSSAGVVEGAWLTLQEVRDHTYIVGDEEDDYLRALIRAAAEVIQASTGHVVESKTVQVQVPCLRPEMQILLRPVRSVLITYFDTDGNSQLVPEDDYILLDYAGIKILRPRPNSSWPQTIPGWPITLSIGAGYETADQVPEQIKQIGRLLVAHWYKFREPVLSGGTPVNVPYSLKYMLDKLRVRFIA